MKRIIAFAVFALLVMALLPVGAGAAGGVTTSFKGPDLWIEGDGLDNTIMIRQPGLGPDEFEVKGYAGTLVDGTASVTVTGVTGSIVVRMGAGDDVVRLRNMTAYGSMDVSGGSGADFIGTEAGVTVPGDLTLRNADMELTSFTHVEGNLSIVTSAGSTKIDLDSSYIEGNLSVVNGDGFDTFDADDVNIDGSVTISNGDGGSNVEFDDAAFLGTVSVVNGTGFDTFEIDDDVVVYGDVIVNHGSGGSKTFYSDDPDNEFKANLSVTARGGNDLFVVDQASCDCVIEGDLTLELGGGDNTVRIENDLEVMGDLTIRTNNGADDINFADPGTSIGGTTSIRTGSGADFFLVGDTAFGDTFTANGGAGTDTFVDGGGNTFPAGSPVLLNIEQIL